MEESAAYEEYLRSAQKAHESRCARCGACCGLFESDPCLKLVLDGDNRTHCADYENRFGLQRSVNGNEFRCVSLREILSGSWTGSWRCAYKKANRAAPL